MKFSDANQKKIAELLTHYPEGPKGKQAALLPVLRLAQEQFGFVSEEVMALVGETLGLSPAYVFSVATFYSQFYKKPVGKHHLQVCTNLSCCLEGAASIYKHLKERLGIKAGEMTKDGRFSLEEVECLAACGTGPVLQVNETYHEKIDSNKKVDELLEKLK